MIRHYDEWPGDGQDIAPAREQYERVDAPGSAELQKAVRHEVAACDAIWQGEWAPGLELIRQVLDALLSHHGVSPNECRSRDHG